MHLNTGVTQIMCCRHNNLLTTTPIDALPGQLHKMLGVKEPRITCV